MLAIYFTDYKHRQKGHWKSGQVLGTTNGGEIDYK